jgi:histidine ammonia-lyase
LIAEYTTAGLCNHIWGLAAPSHLMSVSTDSGQEDHVSMAANVAMRADEAANRLAEVLAIELAFVVRALELRGPDAAGKFAPNIIHAVRAVFPPLTEDRELSWDLMALAEKVHSGEIAKAAGYAFARH